MDTELDAKDLLNNHKGVCGRREKLPLALGEEVSQKNAPVPQVTVEHVVSKAEIEPNREHSKGSELAFEPNDEKAMIACGLDAKPRRQRAR